MAGDTSTPGTYCRSGQIENPLKGTDCTDIILMDVRVFDHNSENFACNLTESEITV